MKLEHMKHDDACLATRIEILHDLCLASFAQSTIFKIRINLSRNRVMVHLVGAKFLYNDLELH